MPWQNNGNGNGDKKNPWGSGGPKRGGSNGGGGGEPPHIDDIIRKGQEQLQQVLPGGGKGIALIVLVAIIGWVASGIYVVDSNENAVVLRFGSYTETTLPGPHWHFPAPFETVEVRGVTDKNLTQIGISGQSVSRRGGTGRLHPNQMLTEDENIVDIRFNVVWQITNLENYLFKITDHEATVAAVSESVMRELVGKNKIIPILRDRGRLQVEAKDAIQATLNKYEAGIAVLEVQIQESAAPDEVKEAFLDVQRAKADAQRYVNDANKYLNEVVPKAEGDAGRITQLAEAYRAKTVAGAEGKAARFLSVYNEYTQAKDVTRKRIYLETMEEILEGMDKIIIDGSAGSGVVPYLPLDQLGKKRKEGQK
ncbi:MAG: FtsH protease activity modulator HflK [Kordiimonadaceae bacterium]|nr:FtsH protease activity modulator HflK [Kordiimonadaceae bacterium]